MRGRSCLFLFAILRRYDIVLPEGWKMYGYGSGDAALSFFLVSLASTIGSLICIGLGYVAYGSVEAGLLVLLLVALYGACIIVAFIPWIGFAVHAALIYFWIWPFFTRVTGLQVSWVTTLFFWLSVIYGLLMTILATESI